MYHVLVSLQWHRKDSLGVMCVCICPVKGDKSIGGRGEGGGERGERERESEQGVSLASLA